MNLMNNLYQAQNYCLECKLWNLNVYINDFSVNIELLSGSGLSLHDIENLCDTMVNKFLSSRLNDKSETDDETTSSDKFPFCD